MIATLTLNPCIDRTVTVDSFHYGETNRADKVQTDICGKGINVSGVLKNLEQETMCFGFCPKEDKEKLQGFLDSRSIPCEFVETEGGLRVNLKIFDASKGILTEVNEKGMTVSGEAFSLLTEKAEEVFEKASVLVLSGSVPPGVPSDIYRIFTEKALKKGIRVILDASGELLKEGIKGKPYLIKPNMEELEELFGRKFEKDEEILKAAESIVESGVSYVCISMGKRGAFLVGKEKAIFSPALPVSVKGIQGAGDSLVAGMCMAIEQEADMETMLRFAVAAAGGSLLREGTKLCEKQEFEKFLKEVKIVPVIY